LLNAFRISEASSAAREFAAILPSQSSIKRSVSSHLASSSLLTVSDGAFAEFVLFESGALMREAFFVAFLFAMRRSSRRNIKAAGDVISP
jgi:hypothetical protein